MDGEPDRLDAVARRYADYEEDVDPLIQSFRARLSWRRRRGVRMCSSCKEQKKPGEFQRDATRRDGLEARCRECRRRRVQSAEK